MESKNDTREMYHAPTQGGLGGEPPTAPAPAARQRVRLARADAADRAAVVEALHEARLLTRQRAPRFADPWLTALGGRP